MSELETVRVTKHIDGDLKGYYVAYIVGFKGQVMKSKTKSVLLGKISKYFRGQGE